MSARIWKSRRLNRSKHFTTLRAHAMAAAIYQNIVTTMPISEEKRGLFRRMLLLDRDPDELSPRRIHRRVIELTLILRRSLERDQRKRRRGVLRLLPNDYPPS